METFAISVFKARCLGILEKVRRTGEPVRVTRFGKPVAEIIPAQSVSAEASWLGCMAEEGRIAGDLVAPVVDEAEWEALRT